MTKFEKDLMMFARQTLRIMEEQQEWSADTLDDIQGAAFNLNLAGCDEDGMFTRMAEIQHYYKGQEALDLN